MKKKLLLWEIIGFLVCSALAPLFHFFYEWSGRNMIVGLFCAQTESVFEHTKILLFPYIIFSVVEYFALKKSGVISRRRFCGVKAMTALLLPLLTISFFYTYSGIIGKTITWLDITSAFLHLAVVFFLSWLLLEKAIGFRYSWQIFLLLLTLWVVMTVYWSVYPPALPLFATAA